MKVRELMTRPPLTIHDSDDVALGLQIMAWGDIRHLPVLHEQTLAGVVSERDLLANERANPRIAEVMTAPAQVASPDDDVAEAAGRMVTARLGCLPVVDHGRVVGIVTVTDVVALEAMRETAQDLRGPVSAAMTRAPLTVGPDDFFLDAVRLLAGKQVRHAPVVDAEQRVVGMLSDRDIRLALGSSLLAVADTAGPPRLRLLKVREAMTREPIVVLESTPVAEATAAFLHKQIGAVPVVDAQRRIVGILSYADVLRMLVDAPGMPGGAS